MKLSHVSWNLVGLGLPLAVAALVVPSLLESLGSQRFGVLALAWGLIGYASAIDLGIGRAVTQGISAIINTRNITREDDVLRAALQVTAITGAMAFVLIVTLALLGAERWMGAADVPSHEKTLSIILLAFALPLQSMSATYRGVNEAHLNFKKVSLLRVGLGIANFGAPYLISNFTIKMHWLVASLLLSRAISFYFYRRFARALIQKENFYASRHRLKLVKILRIRLLKFGGWITVSSTINPIVNAADRFLLASIISASAVTSYVIPFELTTQSLILVGAISTVFFPYAARSANVSAVKLRRDFSKVILASAFMMGCATACYLVFGETVISIWLKNSLSHDSISVLQIVSLGLAPYAIASLSTSLIHSRGLSRLTATVNILMFFPSLASLYFSIKFFGPLGAAATWVIRIFIEALCFYCMALHQIGKIANNGKKEKTQEHRLSAAS